MTATVEHNPTTETDTSTTPVTPPEVTRPQRRNGHLLIAGIALTLSLMAGLILGAVWISSDDQTWLEVFTTPIPTITPTPEIALNYTGNEQVEGYFIWDLASHSEWLIENNSNSNRSLRSAIDLLESRIKWSHADHPSLDEGEQAAVELIQRNIETILLNTLDNNRDFEICFLVHPDERVARTLEMGVRLPVEHSIAFLPGTRYIPAEDFERYMLLESIERSCTTPPAPEKR